MKLVDKMVKQAIEESPEVQELRVENQALAAAIGELSLAIQMLAQQVSAQQTVIQTLHGHVVRSVKDSSIDLRLPADKQKPPSPTKPN